MGAPTGAPAHTSSVASNLIAIGAHTGQAEAEKHGPKTAGANGRTVAIRGHVLKILASAVSGGSRAGQEEKNYSPHKASREPTNLGEILSIDRRAAAPAAPYSRRKTENPIGEALSTLTLATPVGSYKLIIIEKLIYLIIKKIFKNENKGQLAPEIGENLDDKLKIKIYSIPSPIFNAKILCDYMALKIANNPYYHKSVIMEAKSAISPTF